MNRTKQATEPVKRRCCESAVGPYPHTNLCQAGATMSDKPKWTPGPWRVGCPHHTTTKGALPIVAMEHVHVAAVGYDSVQTTSEHEANARLIAAAPLMAEALRRAREYVPADGDDERDMLEVIDAALRAAGVE